MEAFKYHVYICNQEKPEGVPCCRARGGEKLIDALRREVAAQGLGDDVHITTCGSLGLCAWGPNMIVYSEGVWYTGVGAEDVPEIVREHFGRGRPVERLARRDAAAVRAEIETNRAKMLAGLKARDAAGVLPDELMADFRGFQTSRMLLTAVELDLFTAVGGSASAGEIAARLEVDERGAEQLLDALTAYGLLEKHGRRYANSAAARRYLAAGGPDDSRLSLLHLVGLWNRWHTLTECIRKGTSVTYTEAKDRDPGWTEAFIAAMHKNAALRADQVVGVLGVAGFERMLDVGGGSGAYAISFAKANPRLRAEVFDLEPVTAIARRHIDRAGLAERVTTRVGDLHTTEFGSPFDLVFISAICHMNSPEENRQLCHKAFAALRPGGTVAIQDFILNADKTGPFTAALFSLNMLVGTPAGASYSISEYTEWLTGAGFADLRVVALPGPTGLVVACRPEVGPHG
ncbi:MAG TPA: methyltransferase [candidate division Zixibacteria bacterium]|nr:methyltransferase [candidate division Zixibacteria bacterium]